MCHLALILSLVLAAIQTLRPGRRGRPDKERLHEEVARLLGELNSDRFEVRRQAAEQFEKLVAKPELGQDLAAEFQRVLVRSDISFEVRRQVDRWSRRLPSPRAEPVAEVSSKELDHLARQLDDDSYGVRLGAERRLDWLLGNPKLICPIMLRLKRRLSDDSLDREARRRIEPHGNGRAGHGSPATPPAGSCRPFPTSRLAAGSTTWFGLVRAARAARPSANCWTCWPATTTCLA